MPSFPSSVKSFTTKNTGDTIQPADVNDLQDEVNAVEAGYLNGTARLNAGASTLATLSVAGGSTLATLTLAGGQIAFPATQAAAADVNTLDDYEEGTWTPAIGGTATYTTQTGTYTKIGRQVSIQGHLVINAVGTGDTGLVSGLPFTSGTAVVSGTVTSFGSAATAFVSLSCFIVNNTIRFVGLTAASASTSNPVVLFGNGTDVYFSATFFV